MNAEKPNSKLKNWKKSQISLQNYQNYITRKPQHEKFQLTLVDLLYIRNFKGGNATINEYEEEINEKLKKYSSILQHINEKFSGKTIAELSDLDGLISFSNEFLCLSDMNNTPIDGFKSSFLTTLLHSYFPDLYPILDRRILINMEIAVKKDIDSQGQIINISTFYPELIRKVHQICKLENIPLKKVDRLYFIKQLPDWS